MPGTHAALVMVGGRARRIIAGCAYERTCVVTRVYGRETRGARGVRGVRGDRGNLQPAVYIAYHIRAEGVYVPSACMHAHTYLRRPRLRPKRWVAAPVVTAAPAAAEAATKPAESALVAVYAVTTATYGQRITPHTLKCRGRICAKCMNAQTYSYEGHVCGPSCIYVAAQRYVAANICCQYKELPRNPRSPRWARCTR